MLICKLLILLFLFSGQLYLGKPLQPVWSRSYTLYRQPHAVWLVKLGNVYFDTAYLERTLLVAEKQNQVPEIVIYALPPLQNRSVHEQLWESGYRKTNQKAARMMKAFYQRTGIHPVIYLEPDSIGLALDAYANGQISKDALDGRLDLLHQLVLLYKDAGALVYLDATHSDWYGVSDERIRTIASALQQAGLSDAEGFFSNVSNRQKIMPESDTGELGYIKKLLTHLGRDTDVVVDTSRNGWEYLSPRTYQLAADGKILDNEQSSGRLVGHWRKSSRGVVLEPFVGQPRLLSDLSGSEGYRYDEALATVEAPIWLDPVGDVRPGPKPTNATGVSPIDKFRYIKPPDECDGSLACPAGFSKSMANSIIGSRNVVARAPDDFLLALRELWGGLGVMVTTRLLPTKISAAEQ